MQAQNNTATQTVNCSIAHIKQLNKDVRQVFLRLPEGKQISFLPGQYVEIQLEKNGASAFSIANAPTGGQEIELHIRYIPDGGSCDEVTELLNQRSPLQVKLPQGDCVLRPENNNTQIFLAGSTGFAPIKSMLEYCFHKGRQQQLYLYWGGVRQQDLYLHDLASRWSQQHSNFHYIPALSSPPKNSNWQGRNGFIHKCLLEDFQDLSKGIEIYAGGSPGMVYAALEDFEKRGLQRENIYSDVFAYAPRPAPNQANEKQP